MLTTIAKRIQSRLSRTGLKVALSDIKTQCELMIADINTPTEEELLAVQDYFMINATSLTVINENLDNDIDNLDNNLDNGIDNGIDIEAIAMGDDHDYPEQSPKAGELTHAPKNELVVNAAQSLGVVLNDSEIELIATNVNCSSDDLQETLEEIKGAIITFIKHRIATNSQKIEETLNEIVEVASAGFNTNSEQLTNGLRSINQQLQQQSQDFKSKVKTTLKCFQLPEAS